MLGVTEAVDSVMMNIGAFFTIAGGIIMMLFVVGMVGYLVALLWISACNKWRAICRAESLIFEYRKNRKDFLRWMSKAETIVADVRPVVRGRWIKTPSEIGTMDVDRCPVCGCEMNGRNQFWDAPFCPRCGAEMNQG